MNRVNVVRGLRVLYSKSATLFGLGFLALFAQLASAQAPLNYFQSYFVTGDYVAGGVGLYGQGANPTGTINFSGVPCTSGPGIFAGVVPCSAKGAVPADIIAAFLYWETIETDPTGTTPSATAGTFDGASNIIAGLPLGNPQVAACVVGGGTLSKTSYARVYRADVLRYLAIDPTANVRTANYTHTVQFSGLAGTQFNGATLVVVYRLVTPGNPRIAPLRSVVIYDGAFTGVASRSASLNQTMGGFYQSGVSPAAKMTYVAGGGEPNFHETLTVNGNIPPGVDSDPLVGAQGANWDNYTFNYKLPAGASSVQTAVQSTNDCLSYAAIITSTNVQDADFDGLLDVWETSGLYRNPGVRNDGTTTAPTPAVFGTCAQYKQDPANCVNLPAMGANPFVPDIFVQVDWMQYEGSLVNAAGGSAAVPDHIHNPQLAALNMVGAMFKSHGINLHFDAGKSNTYQNRGSPYIIPAAYAQGGNVVQESSVLCEPNPTATPPITCDFTPQSEQYSVLGWKIGFTAIRDGDGVLPQLFARNRLLTFHYSLFGHAIAATTPLSAPAAGSISGVGDLPGGDFMVTLGLWRSDTPSVDQVGTLLDQAGTLGHELGHNLGLGHGGWTDTPVCKPDYPSIMNYLYQVNGLTDAAGNEHLDYSYGLLLPLNEDALSVKTSMGLQSYRVRYFGPLNSIPGSPLANTPGQASKVYCNGNLPDGSEGPYVRLEWPTVSTPDWSNGTIKLGTTLPPLFINYDGIPGESFTDSPDWISLNLQQVGARPNVDGVSLDLGRSDLGRSDLGRSDLGRSDLGRSDLGRSDLGTAALGQDALGDEDYLTYSLSGVNPPVNLAATVATTTPPFSNPNPGGTGVLLKWLPALGSSYDHYNVYLCNASVAACTATTLITSVPGGTPTPSYILYVNDFVDAGATCPATKICYNTAFNILVTGVVQVGSLSSESGVGASNTVSGVEVNHMFVMGNITPQSITYGTTNPTIATNIYGNGSLMANQVVCVYTTSPSSTTPTTPKNVMSTPYAIYCSGPSTVSGSTTDGITYNANYLTYAPSTLTINPYPITVTAVYSTKVYNATTAAGTTSSSPSSPVATPSIAPAVLPYGDMLTSAETYPSINVGSAYVMTPGPIAGANNTTLPINYNPKYVNSAATSVITPAPLTASIIGNPSRPYNGTTAATLAATNFSLSGLQGSDNFTVTQTVGTYSGPNVVNVPPTTVTASLASGNFTPLGGTLATNYTLPTTASGPGSITAVTLTASVINNPTKPYNGNTAVTLNSGNFSLSPLVGSENFTVTQTAGTYNSQNVTTATTVTASLTSGNFTPVGGTLATNYSLPATASGPGAITAVTLTASIINNPTKPYNGNTTATLTSANFSLTPLVSPDNFTVTQTVGTYNSQNVMGATLVTATLGAGNFTPIGATMATNYVLPTTASGTGAITAVTLTASIINNPTRPYDSTAAATLAPANFALSPLVSPDSFTVTQTVGAYNSPYEAIAMTVTASLAPSNFTPAGLTITTNYTLPTTASGAGHITAAPVTAAIVAAGKPYDTTNAAVATCSLTAGVFSADTGNVGCSASGAMFASANAGTWPVTATVTLSGAAAGNYAVASVTPGMASIAQASTATTISTVSPSPATVNQPVTVTVAVAPQIAGTPTGSVTVNSSPAGVSCTVTPLSSATGSCQLTLTTPDAESITATYNGDSNFSGSTTSAPTPLTVNGLTATITAANKPYDGNTNATITSCTLAGVAPTDAGNVTCKASGATFASAMVGNGQTVTATNVSLRGSAAGNYVLASNTATTTANINPDIDFTTTLALNGTAAPAAPAVLTGPPPVLRLTNNVGSETSSAWLTTEQAVASVFSTSFDFQITPAATIPNSNTIADGFAFVIQAATSGTATLGTTGLGMYIGYAGIPNSIAIEFDTYDNSDYGDPVGAHVGIQSNGTGLNSAAHNTSAKLATPVEVPFADGNVHNATITYDGVTLSVFVDGNFVVSAPVVMSTLLSLDGGTNAFVGFTSATGGARENSDILAWSLN